MILELDWDTAASMDRQEKARTDHDFYTITYEGEDKFGNPKYNIANEKNGKSYTVYYSSNYQFCTCADFIFRAKQALVPCKHLYITRWWLEANELTPKMLETQKTYRVQPSEAFFRIQALKEQLQKEVRENGGKSQEPKQRMHRKSSAGAEKKGATQEWLREWKF